MYRAVANTELTIYILHKANKSGDNIESSLQLVLLSVKGIPFGTLLGLLTGSVLRIGPFNYHNIVRVYSVRYFSTLA